MSRSVLSCLTMTEVACQGGGVDMKRATNMDFPATTTGQPTLKASKHHLGGHWAGTLPLSGAARLLVMLGWQLSWRGCVKWCVRASTRNGQCNMGGTDDTDTSSETTDHKLSRESPSVTPGKARDETRHITGRPTDADSEQGPRRG